MATLDPTRSVTEDPVVQKNAWRSRGCAVLRPLAPPLLLERLLQNRDLAVAGGVNIELARSFQGIGIKEHNIVLAVRRGNTQLGTKLTEGSLGRPQTVLAGQGECTGFAVDGGDLPEGRATVHEGIIIDNGADDGGVMEHDGSVRSGHKLGVRGGACQTLRVVLGIAALHRIGEQVAHGRQKARAGGGGGVVVVVVMMMMMMVSSVGGSGGKSRGRRPRDGGEAEGEAALKRRGGREGVEVGVEARHRETVHEVAQPVRHRSGRRRRRELHTHRHTRSFARSLALSLSVSRSGMSRR